jgi:hypothetical protein
MTEEGRMGEMRSTKLDEDERTSNSVLYSGQTRAELKPVRQASDLGPAHIRIDSPSEFKFQISNFKHADCMDCSRSIG